MATVIRRRLLAGISRGVQYRGRRCSRLSASEVTTTSLRMITDGFLSYDILILVLGWLQDDYSSLNACSLVNRTCREASATYLYRKVTYSPEFSPVLDLRKRDDFSVG